jgi:predicted MFS family arabinose efflux permease
MDISKNPDTRQGWGYRLGLVFIPFAGAYFLSLFFRSINAVIAPDLVRELTLSPSDLGLLTAAYFLGFALFQIPLGVFLDRFGARRVQTVMVAIAAAGAAVFAFGESLVLLALGRALIGLGFSGGLMAGYKAIADWFPREKIPLMNGYFLGMGSMGALVATAPAQMAIDLVGWRGLLLAFAAITMAVAAIIFFAVPERHADAGPRTRLAQQVADLKVIYRDRLFWRVAPLTVLCFATGTSVQGLWAGPWLRDVAGLERAAVADQLFVMALALSLGSIFGGVLADALRRFGIGVLFIAGGAALLFMVAELGIILEQIGLSVLLWTVFGATFNVVTLTYSALSQHFPTSFAGRANTAINVMSGGGAFATQYAIGGIITLWPQTEAGNYDPAAYQVALGIMLALQAISLLWFLLFRPPR